MQIKVICDDGSRFYVDITAITTAADVCTDVLLVRRLKEGSHCQYKKLDPSLCRIVLEKADCPHKPLILTPSSNIFGITGAYRLGVRFFRAATATTTAITATIAAICTCNIITASI